MITLNKRVNEYFKMKRMSRYANREMVIKSIAMMSLYFGPYALIISGVFSGVFANLTMIFLMGLGLAGIGLCIMHDGNHGAYANKRWINVVIGYTLNLIGANAFNWKVQHNVLHHSYTNVSDADEDVSQKGPLRFSPHEKWKWYHRYQFIYAWFLYGFMTLLWMFFKDFGQLLRYQRMGWIRYQKSNAWKEWGILITTKVIYFSYIFIIPLLVTPWVWWQVIVGILIMHYITGFLLAIIFQPSHVIEGSEFPKPDINHSLNDNWAIHQLKTTTNYANKSRWFTWFVGGLNFQIEHHLFPGICHVHYPKISGIVRSTASEFGFPYKRVSTFAKALEGHIKLLKRLGKRPA
ncbi:fatty acid desaturase family protein [Reichenbachiella ulvae]|uniref:Acyl-CoA desaturase n=1 Tax=Reichenbachiella ulvae TaxID=2980104 RepID=A0ABT3CQJ7_9BACT|nr:acyl-CoA desaturase [Reichenbachiella ulvae]MCV9385971.1 acyl-CoA desaturase [Reichenbachiella ulvae]